MYWLPRVWFQCFTTVDKYTIEKQIKHNLLVCGIDYNNYPKMVHGNPKVRPDRFWIDQTNVNENRL